MGKFKDAMRRFARGRYGTDKLNTVILWTGIMFLLVALLLSLFLSDKALGIVSPILTILSYVCLFVSLFRCLSRNTYKRYQENRRFLFRMEKLRDREHRYFKCPKCRQSVRVPRGKGKLSISCPRCREKFIRKS